MRPIFARQRLSGVVKCFFNIHRMKRAALTYVKISYYHNQIYTPMILDCHV